MLTRSFLAPGDEQRPQLVRQPQRADGVDPDRLQHRVGIERRIADGELDVAQDAGVVEQHVYARRQLADSSRRCGDARGGAELQRHKRQPLGKTLGQRPERRALVVAVGRDHAVAGLQRQRRERVAEPAVRSGDDDGSHVIGYAA
jgi:hypothetical protein